MKQPKERISIKGKAILVNPHFWIILSMMSALIFLYYVNLTSLTTGSQLFNSLLTNQSLRDLHRSLFLIPLLYAGYVFRLPGAITCWLLLMVAAMPRAIFISPNPDALLRTFVFGAVALAATVLIALEENWRQSEKEANKKLEIAQHNLFSSTIKGQERERQRISQELHDDTLQSLIVTANRLHSLVVSDKNGFNEEARTKLADVRDMVLEIMDGIRRLSRDLRPSILDNLGLIPAVRWLADEMKREIGISIVVLIHGKEKRLNPDVEIIIFRIIQEALNNIRKHSKATEAMVSFDFIQDYLEITIRDNGIGFQIPDSPSDLTIEGKLGLGGMLERAKLIDAKIEFKSELDVGTKTTLNVKYI